MQPLEFVELPNNTNMLATYIDGKYLELLNTPFIENHTMYVPAMELLRYWGFEFEIQNEESVIIKKNSNNHKLTQFGVYGVIDNKYQRFDYDVKSIKKEFFIDAMYFVNEQNITITWEAGSHSVYFASVLHYDGYRFAPPEIFRSKKTLRQFLGTFMCVDGKYYKRKDGNSKVVTPEGAIFLGGGKTSSLVVGEVYRFCFRYEGIFESGNIPFGKIWEICSVDYNRRIGNMLFAEDSWSRINNKTVVSNKKEHSIIDEDEALVSMFRQNSLVLSDRKILSGYLSDIFPDNKRKVNILLCAFDNQLFNDIDNADELDDIFINRSIKKLLNNNGIQMQYAVEAVCLCCETYGVKIKGKKYIAKQKYNEEIQLLLMEREKKWVNPVFKERRIFGDFSYMIPSNWEEKIMDFPREGFFYYPYKGESSMINVGRFKLSGDVDGSCNYQAYISGLAKGIENVVSVTDYSVDGISGKKANFHLPIKDKLFEVDAYLFAYVGYMYLVMFGEDKALTTRLQQFEDDFMKLFELSASETHTLKNESYLKERLELIEELKTCYSKLYKVCDSPTDPNKTGYDNLQGLFRQDVLGYVMYLNSIKENTIEDGLNFLNKIIGENLSYTEAKESIVGDFDIDQFEKTVPHSLRLIVSMEGLQILIKRLDPEAHFFEDKWSPSTEFIDFYMKISRAIIYERLNNKDVEKRYNEYIEMLINYIKEEFEELEQ